MSFANIRLVLFDLDGTLIDSAPDLIGAASEMLAVRGLPGISPACLRPMCGSGARGMLGIAFGAAPGDGQYEALKDEFLDRYEARMFSCTQVFSDIPPLLEGLANANLPWAIVTNKAERFALPLTEALGLRSRAAGVIGGDTTPHTKPHPAPLLEAARRAGFAPTECIYVGDDERDVIAGRAAGMRTAAAAWGYLGLGQPIEAWGADCILSLPKQLLQHLAVP